MTVISQYAVAGFGQRRRMRWRDVFDRKDNVSAIRAERRTQIAWAQAENVILDGGRVAEFGKGLIGLDEFRLTCHKIEFLGDFIDRDSAAAPDIFGNLSGKGFAKLFGLLLLRLRLDGGFHLVKGLRAGCFPVDDLDNMEAILRLDQIRDSPFRQTERRGLKFGHGLPTDNPVQITAFILGRVFGILFGKIGEFSAVLRLVEDVLRFLLDFGDLGIRLADGLEQNVRGMRAVFQLIAVDALLVIDLLFVLRYLGALAELREIQGCVIHGPALGNDVTALVLLEIGRQLGVGSFDLGLQFVWFNYDVIDLDL